MAKKHKNKVEINKIVHKTVHRYYSLDWR